MELWLTKYSTIVVLMCLVIFDCVASYLFWTYSGMVENNPLMLWALKQGWVYWLISAIKIGLVIVLGYGYYNIGSKVCRWCVWVLIAVYSIVWVQYFIGSLI